MQARRFAAVLIDGAPFAAALAVCLTMIEGASAFGFLLATGLVLCWILAATLWGLVMGPTPGKRLMGLVLSGQGCLLCREMRRLFPLVILCLVGAALQDFSFWPVRMDSVWAGPNAVILVATLALVGWYGAQSLGNAQGWWNLSTTYQTRVVG